MSSNLLNLAPALGALVLKYAVGRYIEAAGATSAEMLSRAQAIKSLASSLDSVALGSMSLSAFATATTADLTKANASVSSQILVNGLAALVVSALPASGGLLEVAAAAEANVFLSDIIAVCTSYGA